MRRKHGARISLVSADEVEFVASCRSRFDFIFSDGDHDSAEQRFERVYGELLEDGGILAYHDVANPQYPNLARITGACVERGIAHRLFARSSRPDERCERGLLVIFKDARLSAAAG